MTITFDEHLTPSFELTASETQELRDTGFVVTDQGIAVAMLDDEIKVYKEFDEYDGLTLYHGGRK
jgi:hypothetical protein